ncbi:MAG: glycosyltransferase, partial [Acidobacteriota bacterium]
MIGSPLLDGLAVATLVLAAIPFGLSLFNLLLYRAPPRVSDGPDDATSGADAGGTQPEPATPEVSILIPARDEEAVIGKAVRAALASRPCRVEVLVMDDDSSDATAEIVGRLADEDHRVRLLEAPPLPAGWAGKQHACDALARR